MEIGISVLSLPVIANLSVERTPNRGARRCALPKSAAPLRAARVKRWALGDALVV